MKSILKAISAVALTSVMVLPVLADDTSSTSSNDGTDQKDLKKVIEDQGINYVETAQKGITLSGYVDTSYTEQFGGRGTGFGGSQALGHTFDVHNDNFNINAVKIALEKALPDKNDWAAGFRIDTIYGQDAQVLNAASGYSSGSDFYLEQALVKFRIPVGNGLDIYAGKFVTFLGYEVIESPANPNFSRGLLFTQTIPLTHTGVYADYKFNDVVEAKLGIVDGNNFDISPGNQNSTANGTDLQNDYPFGGKAITGQINITNPGKNANICESFIYAPGGFNGSNQTAGTNPGDNGPAVIEDIWGNWSPTFVKDSALTLGFDLDFGYNGASGQPYQTNNGFASGSNGSTLGGISDSQEWWGAALYAQYKLNKVITLAARAEYVHEDGGYVPQFNATTTGGSLSQESVDEFSETLTASFAIWDNLLTRVEYRFDSVGSGSYGSSSAIANNVVTYQQQNEVSLEAVYSF